MSAPTHLERGMTAAAQRICPGFRASGPPWLTGTSALLPGVIGDMEVVAKRPVDLRPFWIDRARHEIAVYRVLHAHPPHAPTPRLVGADPHEPLLITTVAGRRPLHPDRYLGEPVAATTLAAMLGLLDRLHGWHPRGLPRDDDYPVQLTALRHPLLGHDERESLVQLHDLASVPVQVEHGDAHLGNALEPPTNPTLIDFEFTAWRPAGYDLAKLWVYLSAESNRRQILDHLGDDPHRRAAFWVSAVLVLTREIASYRRDPAQPGGAALAQRLHNDLRHVLRHTQRLIYLLSERASAQ